MKKALILTTVSGFLMKFEMQDVQILQSMGYEVHYASNFDVPKYAFERDELVCRGIRLHPISVEKSPFCLNQNRRALREVVRLIREEEIRLIHCHTPVGGLIGRLAGRRCKDLDVRVIYTAHGFHFYQGCPAKDRLLYGTAERLMARETDVLVVINREDYESALRFRLKKGGRVYQIPGVGLDLQRFHPLSDERRREVRARLGIPDDALFLLSVGEVNRNKNHIAVLKALEWLQEKETCGESVRRPVNGSAAVPVKKGKSGIEKICYLVCGDGPSREELVQWVRQHRLEHIVSFPGYCANPEEICAAADLFLFPSRREGLGMAALEALACGTPVAAADNRGAREYILPGENGWMCRWDVPEDYAAAVLKWQQMTSQEKREMRNVCRESVKRFDKKHTAAVMETVYRDIDAAIVETRLE